MIKFPQVDPGNLRWQAMGNWHGNYSHFTMTIGKEILWLFILAAPIACVAWTVTHEEVFREPREYCINRSKSVKTLIGRKFFYLFTCEYCFSHYVTIVFMAITDYHLLLSDWRGYIIGGFALVWIANIYMSLFALIRIDIKKERTEIEALDNDIFKKRTSTNPRPDVLKDEKVKQN